MFSQSDGRMRQEERRRAANLASSAPDTNGEIFLPGSVFLLFLLSCKFFSVKASIKSGREEKKKRAAKDLKCNRPFE